MRRSLSLILLLVPLACAPVRRDGGARLSSDESAQDAALDQKLADVWTRWDAARAYLLDQVVEKKTTVTRADWESRVDPKLSAAELAQLKERHKALIAQSQAESAARSRLDLARVREGGKVTAFCHELPKGGMLHVHPWGTLDRPTAEAILASVNPKLDVPKLSQTLNSPGNTGALYADELAALQALGSRYAAAPRYLDLSEEDRAFVAGLFFLPPGSHSFDRFTAVFTLISALVFSNEAVDPEPAMWRAFFQRAHERNLRFVEVSRFIVPKPQWFQSLPAWAAKVEQDHQVTVRLHAAYARNKDAAFTRSKAEQLLKMPASDIVSGIDFLADETGTPALEQGQTLYAPVLAAVSKGQSKLHRTAHAGELGDQRNVRDMMLMGAERVGHGVRLHEDPVALEYARLHAFPVEVNLNSNLRLRVVSDLAAHPFLDYLRLGLPVSLSTDDEGIFGTTIDDECITAVSGTDISYDELRRTSFNSLKTAFVDESKRAKLLAELEQDFAAFETKWSAP